MTKQQQRYLLRILWRETKHAGRDDERKAADYLARIITAAGLRVRVA